MQDVECEVAAPLRPFIVLLRRDGFGDAGPAGEDPLGNGSVRVDLAGSGCAARQARRWDHSGRPGSGRLTGPDGHRHIGVALRSCNPRGPVRVHACPVSPPPLTKSDARVSMGLRRLA